jgi:hypothetical protein
MPVLNAPNHPVPINSRVKVYRINDPDPNNWILKGKYEGLYGENNELYTLSNYRMRGNPEIDIVDLYDIPRSQYYLVLDQEANNFSNLPPASATLAPTNYLPAFPVNIPPSPYVPSSPFQMNTAFEPLQPAPLVPTPAYNPDVEGLQPTSLMSAFNAANNLPAVQQPHNSARRRRNTRRRSRARRVSRARRHRRS